MRVVITEDDEAADSGPGLLGRDVAVVLVGADVVRAVARDALDDEREEDGVDEDHGAHGNHEGVEEERLVQPAAAMRRRLD